MLYDRVKYELIYEGKSIMIEEPKGWSDDSRSWVRNKTQHGIVMELSSNLDYYETGFELIQEAFRRGGVNADLRLIKSRRNEKDLWELDYEGVFDFTTYSRKQNHVSIKFNANKYTLLYKTNKDKKLTYRDDTRLDGSDRTIIDGVREIEINEISLQNESKIVQTKAVTGKYNMHYGASGDWRTSHRSLELTLIPDYVNSDQNVVPVSQNSCVSSKPDHDGLCRSFYKFDSVDKDITIVSNFDFDFEVMCGFKTVNNRYRLHFVVYDSVTGKVVSRQLIYEKRFNRRYKDHSKKYNVKFNIASTNKFRLLADQTIAIEHELGANFGGSIARDMDLIFHRNRTTSASLNVASVTTVPPSTNKCITFHDAFRFAVDSALGCEFKSELLTSGKFGELCLSHGFWLREFNESTDGFKYPEFSLGELIKALNGVTPIGVSITDVLRVESVDYFYRDTIIKDIGIVENIEVNPNPDFLYNIVKTGFKKFRGLDNGGTFYEYNTSSMYSTPIINASKTYDAECAFRADSDGMSELRIFDRELKEERTETNSSDNEIWIIDSINLGPSKYRSALHPDYFDEPPKGIFDTENAINLRLSPANSFLRHSILIGNSLELIRNKNVKFISSTGITSLSTKLEGEDWVFENQDFNFSNISALTLGLKIKFETHDKIDEVRGHSNGVPNYYGLLMLKDKEKTKYFIYIDKITRGKDSTKVEGTIKKII